MDDCDNFELCSLRYIIIIYSFTVEAQLQNQVTGFINYMSPVVIHPGHMRQNKDLKPTNSKAELNNCTNYEYEQNMIDCDTL